MILVVIFLVAPCINLPPLDGHSWRQCYTLGVSERYMESGDFFYPRTIICDSRDGIIAQEFPLLNGLIATGWTIFGKEYWVYRILLIASFLSSIWFFYKIVEKLSSSFFHPIIASSFFAFSIFFTYGKKAMPDTFAISLVLAATYFGIKYLQHSKLKHIAIFISLMSLGLLSKMPSIISGCLIIPFLLSSKIKSRNKIILLASGVIPLILLLIWYFIWSPYLYEIEKFILYFPTSFSDGWNEFLENRNNLWFFLQYSIFRNWINIYILFVGIALCFQLQHRKYLPMLLAGLGLTFFFMLKAGKIFCTHEYYLLPTLPLLCIILALPFNLLNRYIRNWGTLLIFPLLFLSVNNQLWDQKVRPDQAMFLGLTEIVNEHIPSDAKVLTNDTEGGPTMMYFTGRRGWNDQRFHNEEWVRGEHTVGLDYLVLVKSRVKDSLNFPQLFQDDHFVIYKVE